MRRRWQFAERPPGDRRGTLESVRHEPVLSTWKANYLGLIGFV
jgi:hypothetical protein